MVSLTVSNQNDSNIENYNNINTLVQKYGGTSVGTSEAMLNVSNIIKNTLKTSKVVAVLSAMSSQKKSEGTTSKLIKAMENIRNPKYVLEITNEIKDYHIQVAKEAIDNKEILNEIIENINKEFLTLNTFLKALSVVGEISSKSKDYIISVGEKLSANLLAGILKNQGIDSCYINLEHTIEYSDLSIYNTTLSNKFFNTISEKFSVIIQECLNQDKVPVVTGFFGVIPGSLLSTIGRGYTDLCAALIAVGIKAKELQIWKEVDGIYTADPRKTPKAKLLKQLTASEAEELTYFGSEVIHPYVMKQAVLAGIPVKIKCVFNPEDEGTLIVLNDEVDSKCSSDSDIYLENEPTAVTIKDNATLIHIHLNSKSGDNNSYNTFYLILKLLDDCGISADLVTISQNKIVMAITESGKKLERFILKVKESQDTDIKRGMSIVALITTPTIDKVLLTSKMLKVLSQNGIKVEMISHGASNNNIALVVLNEEAIKAMQLIHDECIVPTNMINSTFVNANDINEKQLNLYEDMSTSENEKSIQNGSNPDNSYKSLSIESSNKTMKNKLKKSKNIIKSSSFKRFFSFRKNSSKNILN